jgi:hypothetical protein
MPTSFYFRETARKALILLGNLTGEIFPTEKGCCGNFAKLVFFDQTSGAQNCRFDWARKVKIGRRSNVGVNRR